MKMKIKNFSSVKTAHFSCFYSLLMENKMIHKPQRENFLLPSIHTKEDNECKSEKKYCDITHKSTTPSDMSLEFQ